MDTICARPLKEATCDKKQRSKRWINPFTIKKIVASQWNFHASPSSPRTTTHRNRSAIGPVYAVEANRKKSWQPQRNCWRGAPVSAQLCQTLAFCKRNGTRKRVYIFFPNRKRSKANSAPFMAGVEGFEPSQKVLETLVLPLHYTPMAFELRII